MFGHRLTAVVFSANIERPVRVFVQVFDATVTRREIELEDSFVNSQRNSYL